MIPRIRGGADRGRRAAVIGAAAALFAAVFALRLAAGSSYEGLLLFFVVPIALLGIELGVAGGVAGASVAIALLAVYGAIDEPSLNFSGYANVGIAFALIGGIVGILAQRLRRAVEAHERAEAELKAESARLVSEGLKGAILDASLDCLITIDHAGRVLEFNRTAEETFGYEREEVIGRELAALIVPPDLRQRHRIALRRRVYADEGAVLDRRIELTGMRKGGSVFPVELAVTRVPGTYPPIFAGYIRDITERKRNEEREHAQSEEIAKLAEARGELVAQLLLAEERTRRGIAQALHDDALQRLLSAHQDLIEAAPGRAGVTRAHKALEGTIDRLRDAVVALHPVTLQQGDLETALNAIARQHAARGRLRHTVSVDQDAAGHQDDLVLSLARELVANVARHAHASRCSINVTREGELVTLEVADDGRGIPPGRQDRALREGHIGLASAIQRVQAIGGEAEVWSGPGSGTVVQARVPIVEREAVEQPG